MASQKDYFRKQGVMVIVPPRFRAAFFQVANKQKDRSLSSWLRPKLLAWLAEEKPELKPEIDAFLQAERLLASLRDPRGSVMRKNPKE